MSRQQQAAVGRRRQSHRCWSCHYIHQPPGNHHRPGILAGRMQRRPHRAVPLITSAGASDGVVRGGANSSMSKKAMPSSSPGKGRPGMCDQEALQPLGISCCCCCCCCCCWGAEACPRCVSTACHGPAAAGAVMPATCITGRCWCAAACRAPGWARVRLGGGCSCCAAAPAPLAPCPWRSSWLELDSRARSGVMARRAAPGRGAHGLAGGAWGSPSAPIIRSWVTTPLDGLCPRSDGVSSGTAQRQRMCRQYPVIDRLPLPAVFRGCGSDRGRIMPARSPAPATRFEPRWELGRQQASLKLDSRHTKSLAQTTLGLISKAAVTAPVFSALWPY